MRIFFSAGEASGDAYGAAILETLLLRFGHLKVQAVGGRQLRTAGAQIVADSSNWGAIGIAESLKVYPRARAGLRKAQQALAAGKPGVFVPIDYGYMNIGLARLAKQLGWKVVYFSPPGAWRRDKQGADLPNVADAIVTPFSWSAEILNRMGGNAHWFGHPIKQMIGSSQGPENDERRTTNDSRSIAVLPGSRPSEIDLILPLFAEVVRDLPELVEVAVAPALDLEDIQRRWKAVAPNRADTFTVGETYGVLRRARAALVCSGTATLEAALCGCPHVVAYKVSKLVELQARLIRFKVTHIAQPNILLNRTIVPEFIQHAATPSAIRAALRELLDEPLARERQLSAFQELDEILGPDDAIDRTAALIGSYFCGVAEGSQV